MILFGKDIRHRDFLLDSTDVFVNHGALGATTRVVYEHRTRLLREQEEKPDRWYNQNYIKLWYENLVTVSAFLRADPKNLVFVRNTTEGINVVTRSFNLKDGDAILLDQFTYFSVKNMCQYWKDHAGIQVITVEHPYPVKDVNQVVEKYEEILSQNPRIRLSIITYISCKSAVKMPVNDLIAVCRRYSTKVLIDGAHVPGQVDINLENLGADFFVGNLHKWAFAPRACGVLWVQPEYHYTVFPLSSSRYSRSDWQINFCYLGTSDNTQAFSSAVAIEYFNEIGGMPVISNYNTKLITEAADLLVEKWGTQHYQLPDDMKPPYMRMVELPHLKKYMPPLSDLAVMQCDPVDLPDVVSVLRERFGIHTMCFAVHGIPWIRLRAMIYNCLDDYQRLADAVSTLMEEQDKNGLFHRLDQSIISF